MPPSFFVPSFLLSHPRMHYKLISIQDFPVSILCITPFAYAQGVPGRLVHTDRQNHRKRPIAVEDRLCMPQINSLNQVKSEQTWYVVQHNIIKHKWLGRKIGRTAKPVRAIGLAGDMKIAVAYRTAVVRRNLHFHSLKLPHSLHRQSALSHSLSRRTEIGSRGISYVIAKQKSSPSCWSPVIG